jgi:Raf kinase inhibitor-like YbhB/YbcL family protein
LSSRCNRQGAKIAKTAANKLWHLGMLAGLACWLAGGTAMAFELKSPAFTPGGDIPVKHTCDGPDRSPLLRWSDPPAGTKEFALIVDDPDAPVGTWVHWVLYGVPSAARELPEGVAARDTVPDVGTQGVNDFRKVGYGGPCPPPGPAHRYFFKLYALGAELKLPPGKTKAVLLKAMEGHVLGQTELMGRYKRR